MLSWSVPVEIADMAETRPQIKASIYADFKRLFEGKAGAARQD
jgi:hypothetical protein